MDWISIDKEMPPQKWAVMVKNGKTILPYVKYYRKKWHHWDRILHKVTHWKYCPGCEPRIPIKDMRAYLRRAKKYRHQMQKRNFTLAQRFI